MNLDKERRKGFTTYLQPLAFHFVVNRPLVECAETLQSKHDLHVIGPSHHIKIDPPNEKVQKFSIHQPRRIISITAIGSFTAISDASTEIAGKINSDFTTFVLIGLFALVVVAFAMLSGGSGAICFGPLALLILGIGGIIELISQFYAKLGMYALLRRAFDS